MDSLGMENSFSQILMYIVLLGLKQEVKWRPEKNSTTEEIMELYSSVL